MHKAFMKSPISIFSIFFIMTFSTTNTQAQDLSNDQCLKPRFWFKGNENQTKFKVDEINTLKGITVYLNSNCRTTKPRYELTMFKFECPNGSFSESSCHGMEMYDLGETIANYKLESGEKFTITLFATLYFGQYSNGYIELTKEFLIE